MIAEQIERIITLKSQQREINAKLKQESKPTMTAINILPRMVAWLTQECQEEDESTKIRIVLFVVCAMYAPITLTKNPLPRGLRNNIGKSFKIKGNMVSYYLNGLFLYYKRYRSFRAEADRLILKLTEDFLPNT